MKNLLLKQIDALSHVAESIEYDCYEKLVSVCKEAVDKNNSIITTGLGKNVPICEKFVGTMLSLGFRANFLNTNTAIHGDLGCVRDGDVVIVLTKSGETQESIYLVEQLKKRNIVLWLLSFKNNSTLSNEIENKIIMDLENEGDRWNLVPNNSSLSYLMILQGLAMRLVEEFDVQIDVFKSNHPGGHIGHKLKSL